MNSIHERLPGDANRGGVELLGGNVAETDALAFVELPKHANLPHAKGTVAVRRKRANASRLRAGKMRPATDHEVA